MSEDKGERTGLAIRYIEEGDGDPRHGTWNGYCNLRCRCTECRTAWTAYYVAHRNKPRSALDPSDPRHGSENAYRYWHCKCRTCLDGHRDRTKRAAA